MALILKKELDSGIELKYHRIYQVVYEYDLGMITVGLKSYVDEIKRTSEKEDQTARYANITHFCIPVEKFPKDINEVYTLLKETTEFENATDSD